jgi:hypothetical protein
MRVLRARDDGREEEGRREEETDTPEQVIRKLREAERLLGEGVQVPEVAKALEVTRAPRLPASPPAGREANQQTTDSHSRWTDERGLVSIAAAESRSPAPDQEPDQCRQ